MIVPEKIRDRAAHLANRKSHPAGFGLAHRGVVRASVEDPLAALRIHLHGNIPQPERVAARLYPTRRPELDRLLRDVLQGCEQPVGVLVAFAAAFRLTGETQ